MTLSKVTPALVLLCGAQFLIVLDVTIVAIALPDIRDSLGFSAANLQWVLSAYTLAIGGLLVVAGRAGDLVGQRRLFATGVAGFGAASLACALATVPAALLVARAAQGVAAAALTPAALALLTAAFEAPDERRRAVGWWTAAAAGGGASGWVLGGVLVQAFGLPAVFLVNVPLCAAGALLAPRVLPETRRGGAGRASVPTWRRGGAGRASVPTWRRGGAGRASVPTWRRGGAGRASVPTWRCRGAGRASVPTWRRGGAGRASTAETRRRGGGGAARMPARRRRIDGSRLDVAGAVTVTAGLGLLVLGLTRVESSRPADLWALGSLAAALAALALFVRLERRAADPILPPWALRRPAFARASGAAVALTASTTSAMFLAILYQQGPLGRAALATGLWCVPFNLSVIAGSLLGPRIRRPRVAMTGGLLAVAAGAAVMIAPSPAALPPAFLLMGGGLGVAAVASTASGTTALGEHDQGVAAGVLNAAAQVGTALGLAVVATLFAETGYRTGFAAAAAIALVAALAVTRWSPRSRRRPTAPAPVTFDAVTRSSPRSRRPRTRPRR